MYGVSRDPCMILLEGFGTFTSIIQHTLSPRLKFSLFFIIFLIWVLFISHFYIGKIVGLSL